MGILKKNRVWLAVWIMVLITGILTGCGDTKQTATQSEDANTKSVSVIEKLSIVCTTYPQYDWVMQILGDNQKHVNLTYLLKNGVDIHSYQPSVEDMITISDCDLLIYVGGQSEQWVEDARKNNRNQNQRAINMMEFLGERVWEEEVVEGMQEEHVHTEENDSASKEIEYDEHVWLSLKNAELICQEISDVLKELDSENQAVYQENTDAYLKKLENLDAKYQSAVDAAAQKTILFADRFPFRYLVEDYGLDYYAAFAGCSAETEASFETIAFLTDKVDERNLPVIYRIETSDDSIAWTIINSTAEKNQSILTLDSMQSVTEEEMNGGVTYLSIMEYNLEMLKRGLRCE